jgi:hypothetical protein
VNGIRCHDCQRVIPPGVMWSKRIECRLLNGIEQVFGVNITGFPLSKAAGLPLVWIKHSKCYWAAEKRERRASA